MNARTISTLIDFGLKAISEEDNNFLKGFAFSPLNGLVSV